MPRIFLKPRSPEYADEPQKPAPGRHCDMPGCRAEAPHKAPRDRALSDYYWFCADHIAEYNKAWDFFSGMNERDIEDHITRSFLWDRPTRRFDTGDVHEKLYRAAWQARNFSEDAPPDAQEGKGFKFSAAQQQTPEVQAMAIMNLEPPLSLATIKARYKALVKKYHPDLNPNDAKAEDMIKNINMAYTILKVAYEKFDETCQ